MATNKGKPMLTRIFISLAGVSLVLASCGGSDGGSSAQGDVAALLLDPIEAAGLTVDSACFKDAAAKLSDDDAAAIVAVGLNATPDLSEEGNETAGAILDCIDDDDLMGQITKKVNDGDTENECLMDAVQDGAEPEDAFGVLNQCVLNG
jgi:hypothetical protein